MFGLMKILRKETENTEYNVFNLYPGCVVGFGFIPQRNISGCRMTVKSLNSYTFGDDTFLAYVMGDEENEISMIASKDADSGETHLSLSQKVEERVFSMLFLSSQPDSWFSIPVGTEIKTSHKVMGMQQSWVAPSYRLAMTATGSVTEGDHRQMKKNYGVEPVSREFEYALLLDEDNEHALEAEKYSDGTLVVYSTVYRPLTDIGAITRPSENTPKFSAANDEKTEVTKPEVTTLEILEKRAANVIKLNTGETAPAKAEPAKEEEEKEEEEEEEEARHNDLIAMEAKLAARIIEEASNNKMSISDLIRKVIDLPANINDEVMIAFSLSEAEQNELARRYHLKQTDHDGIKKNIVQELSQFVGNKK